MTKSGFLSPAEAMDAIGIHVTTQIAGPDDPVGLPEQTWVEQEDGYIGGVPPGHATMLIWFDNRIGLEGSVVACTIDGKRNHTMLKNRRPEMQVAPAGNHPVYRRVVTIKTNDAGVSHTEFPANMVRILRIVQGAGRPKVEIYEVSIVSQKGAFFVCFQQTNEVHVFQTGDGTIILPSIEDGSMKVFIGDFVTAYLTAHPLPLPAVTDYVGSARLDGSDLSEGEARVIWFNQAQGFGLVVTQKDKRAIEARIHWSALPERWVCNGRPGRKVAFRGEILSFDEIGSPRMGTASGYAQQRSTTFQWEVLGHVTVAEGFSTQRV